MCAAGHRWCLACTGKAQIGLNKIPMAPGAVPVLGHLPEYWIQRDFTQVFLRWHETAQEPLLRIQVAHKLFVLLADPSAAATILGRGPNSVPHKVPEFAVFDKATGLHGHHSILTEQDEATWVAVRKALAPAYTPAANKQNYAAALAAYTAVASRVSAAISKTTPQSAAGAITAPGHTSTGVTATVSLAPSADVQIDHHMLAAAIQTQVEGSFGMAPSCGIIHLQAATDLETAIGIVHCYPVQPWLSVLHSLVPWATATGRQLREARLRLAHCV